MKYGSLGVALGLMLAYSPSAEAQKLRPNQLIYSSVPLVSKPQKILDSVPTQHSPSQVFNGEILKRLRSRYRFALKERKNHQNLYNQLSLDKSVHVTTDTDDILKTSRDVYYQTFSSRGQQAFKISTTKSYAHGPYVSCNGEKVTWTTADFDIKVLDVDRREIFTFNPTNERYTPFIRDNSLFYTEWVNEKQRNVFKIDLQQGQADWKVTPINVGYSVKKDQFISDVSCDGTKIAYLTSPGFGSNSTNDFVIADLSTEKNTHVKVPNSVQLSSVVFNYSDGKATSISISGYPKQSEQKLPRKLLKVPLEKLLE